MIRIYYMRLNGDCSKEQSLALYKMLPQERRESVDRAKRQEIAQKRLYTGAFLQHVLSKETGLSVGQLHYRYNEWGKPELDVDIILRETDLDTSSQDLIRHIYFNLSHSGEYVVLAVSDSPVGVDVEHKSKSYEILAKRCFCEEEYKDIQAAITEEERKHRFLEYWTMKEAYIKCIGEGMRIPMNSFQIQRGAEGLSSVLEENMCFKTWFLGGRYCVSVCCSVLESMEKHLDTDSIYVEDFWTE